MVQQVNISPLGVASRIQQVITGGVHVITKFDTGKVFILTSSVSIPPGAALPGINLPSASAVEPGFFATVLVGDSNSTVWAVQRADTAGNQVSGNFAQGNSGSAATNFLQGDSGVRINGVGFPPAHTPGLRLEIYCDGVTWQLEGYGNVSRDTTVDGGWIFL